MCFAVEGPSICSEFGGWHTEDLHWAPLKSCANPCIGVETDLGNCDMEYLNCPEGCDCVPRYGPIANDILDRFYLPPYTQPNPAFEVAKILQPHICKCPDNKLWGQYGDGNYLEIGFYGGDGTDSSSSSSSSSISSSTSSGGGPGTGTNTNTIDTSTGTGTVTSDSTSTSSSTTDTTSSSSSSSSSSSGGGDCLCTPASRDSCLAQGGTPACFDGTKPDGVEGVDYINMNSKCYLTGTGTGSSGGGSSSGGSSGGGPTPSPNCDNGASCIDSCTDLVSGDDKCAEFCAGYSLYKETCLTFECDPNSQFGDANDDACCKCK
ncbi:MAG: hypothetical protein V1744_05595, partial [Candidatus Altiarchaeota archaeon]